MRRILRFLNSKLWIIMISVVVQLLFVIFGVYAIQLYSINLYFILYACSILVAIYVSNRGDNPTYRMTWVMLILGFPVAGAIFYLLLGAKKMPKALRVRDEVLQKGIAAYSHQEAEITEYIQNEDPSAYKQLEYVWNAATFPAYTDTSSTYYDSGESCYEALKDELRKAQHFIFLEYFIIDKGMVWDEILNILIEKAAEGVDVRIIYDDFGCATSLKNNYPAYLAEKGIKAKAFNPLTIRLVVQMNNRDHRKIMVIDGKTAITGGFNLADEYINKINLYGHWKDSGLLIRGEAVWSFTLMFLQFWNYDERVKDDFSAYRIKNQTVEADGLVLPFCDSPTDEENVAESIHLNMINNANAYLYVTTPYLIIDQEMKTSLILAAKNGVDVRIIVPHIPDKWLVFQMTQHNYQHLTKHGVKIYEYTPGFIHAKNMISDDRFAVVGTVNMDYRSYYLHYECGAWLYQTQSIKDIKADYLKTLQRSEEITYEDCMNVKLPVRILRAILNIGAPLL